MYSSKYRFCYHSNNTQRRLIGSRLTVRVPKKNMYIEIFYLK